MSGADCGQTLLPLYSVAKKNLPPCTDSTKCTLTKCTVGAGNFLKIFLNLAQQWNTVGPKMYKLEHNKSVFFYTKEYIERAETPDKRINAEEKAKVVAADWGAEFIKFLSTLFI